MPLTKSTPVDKSEHRVRSMFGEIAEQYDFLNHLLSLNIDKYWRWQTVRRVPPQGSEPILDLCTGTGDLAFAYHRASGGKAPIVAADFCPQMLQIGMNKRQQAGLHGELTFVEADAQQLPFEDDEFQIVCVAFGLRNVRDTDRGLREMIRVCQRGGKVVVLEFSKPRWKPFRWFYQGYFQHILPRIGQLLAKNSSKAYTYLPRSVGEFPDGEALCEKMRTAGLHDVTYCPLTFGVATLYVGTK